MTEDAVPAKEVKVVNDLAKNQRGSAKPAEDKK